MTGLTAVAEQEGNTVTWHAYRLDATTFGVFDTFADEAGRIAHLQGQIRAALQDAARTKPVAPPDIQPVDLLGVKTRG